MNSNVRKTETTKPYSQGVWKFLILFATTIAVTFVMTFLAADFLTPEDLREGDIARRTVRASRDILVEDVDSTNLRREEAVKSLPSIFSLDDRTERGPRHRVDELFSALREQGEFSAEGQLKVQTTARERSNIQRLFRLDLLDSDWELLESTAVWPDIERDFVTILSPLVERGIIANKRHLHNLLTTSARVELSPVSGAEKTFVNDDSYIYDLSEAMEQVEVRLQKILGESPSGYVSLIRKLCLSFLEPNVFFDQEATIGLQEDARRRTNPSFYRIQKGEVIIRGGDRVNAEHLWKLAQLRVELGAANLTRMMIGFGLLTLLVFLFVYAFIRSIWAQKFNPQNRDLLLLSCVIVGSFVLLRISLVLGAAFSAAYFGVGEQAIIYIAPVAAGGMLLQVTMGFPSVMFFTICFGLLSGVFMQNSWPIVLLIFAGNFIGAVSVKNCARRSIFLVAGLRVAVLNTAILLCFVFVYPEMVNSENISRVLCGFFGGVISGVVAAGLTPLAEFIGAYITDIKLLELASLDQPLLRELSVSAPGTWNHSVVVGQMGEQAAKEIDANGMLVRVGAYYHDIGKTKKPLYFIENQGGRENRHDKLAPSMSALIIKSHVKDGGEMARNSRLPQPLIDLICQHHGTSRIEYFYEKAKKEVEEGQEVDVALYSYPGPRPQTREAGILMLADSVEASSKSLTDPSPAKIQGLVQKIINKVFASGELDESELTLRDLHLIAKSFTRVLTGIYARRIQYNEPAEKVYQARASRPSETTLPAVIEGTDIEGTRIESAGIDGNGPEKKNKREGTENGSGSVNQGTPADTATGRETGNDGKEALKRLGL
ncbi:MAG: HDIG domain-containing protein [bacterium]|nr:HDIG domain-containing protein [bacterium]